MATQLQIPGLIVDAAIGRGSSGVVYRARRSDADLQVALKVFHTFDSEARNAALRQRVRREAAYLATLSHPGVVRIFEVGEHRGRPFIAMEFVDGPNLGDELVSAPLPFPRLLSLARSVADTLAAVADRGMVHRDLKPQNVLLAADGRTKVIDFGLAAVVDELRASDEQRTVGTCLYASPEQAGMLKRPVDGRSDLYSLGAVLFHCACGRAPFTGQSAAEVVHQHAAAPVPDVRAFHPSLPAAFAEIIHRLLEKDPDRRFQDGHEVVAAIDLIAELDGPHDRARHRVIDRFDPILSAREEEFKRLIKVAEGPRAPTIYHVSGACGSGTRSLARALGHKLSVTYGADLLFGVCTPESDHPLRPFARALDAYLAGDDPTGAPPTRGERLEQALAHDRSGLPLASLLTPLCRQLRGFAGEQPPLKSPENQVAVALSELLLGLSRQRPLVVLIEEIQWLDGRGLDWLRHLRGQVELSNIIFVCTSTSPPEALLQRLLAEQEDGTVTLQPLSQHAASRLVVTALGTRDIDADLLAAIRRRTTDQPEALIECIYTLINRGALYPHWGTWQLDHERLERIAIPRDLEQLLTLRIRNLDPPTRAALEWAALFGATFSLEHLSLVVDGAETEVTRAVEAATRAGIVERVSNQLYRHVHPRVQRFLLEHLSQARQRACHRAIAQALDTIKTPSVDEVLARARHYHLSLTKETARRTDQTNRIAGTWSARTGAAESAYHHLRAAIEARSIGGLPSDPDLSAELGDICLRTGRIDEARSCISTLLSDTSDPVLRAHYRARMAAIYRAELEFDQVWNELTSGFNELGIRSLHAPTQIGSVLAGRALARLSLPKRRLSDVARRRATVLTTLCEYAALTACYDLRPDDMQRALLIPQYAISQLGATPEVVGLETTAAFAFASYSELELAATQLGRAKKHAASLGHPILRARCAAAQAAVYAFSGKPIEAEAAHEEVLHDHGLWLDAVDYARSCVVHAWGLWMRGHCNQARGLLQSGPRGPAGRPGIQPQARFWAALGYWTASACEATSGNRGNARALVKRAQALTQGRSVGRFHSAYALMIEMLSTLDGIETPRPDVRDAWEQRWEALDLKVASTPMLLRPLWLARVWIAARDASRFVEQRPPVSAISQVERRLIELERAGGHEPSLSAHASVIKAVLQRLLGRYDQALDYLGTAQTQALMGDNSWVLFECTNERARVLQAMGLHDASQREARQALSLANECGWSARIRRITPEFHLGGTNAPSLLSRGSSSSPKPPGQLSRYLDALLAVSRVAVTRHDPEDQARHILDELIATLGAERALLYTFDDADSNLTFRAGRNLDGHDLPPQDNISWTVLEHVAATRTIKLISGDDDGEVTNSDSVVSHQLKSIVAAPLVVGSRLIGVAYLDNHLVRGLFSRDDLMILGAMCNHVAIALESASMARFMQNARDQAVEAARLRSAFLTHMSHELRTPLNAILGYAEMVKEDVAKQLPDTLPDLERITVAGRHLLGIIADILELSKLESGNARVQGSEIDVPQLVFGATDPYHAACAHSGNQLHVNCSPSLGTLFSDREKLLRVLQHLLDNAVKFTEGGKIDVRAEWRHHADGRRLAIEVADTGIGMTPDQLENLFTPFYQGDMSTTRRYGGTGIGMALSKHLVGLLGGSLYVESRSGKGTCFTVLLPPHLPTA